ncbi:MFS transporter [Thermus thermamylovorans]|uniref:MFS transporter n=1 Tax=Thermus thermamylovorans TaxID=2509362 RepID=A0A4Q9B698_9DEIN|nr:MFS transporter [Thermus thermamylovorans]TBH21236.1 MFS transporter [Thermus thermamylovorans]
MRLAVVLSGVALYSALYAVVPLLPLLEALFLAPPGAAGPGMGLPLLLLVLLSPLVPKLSLPAGLLLGGGLVLVGLGGVLGASSPSLFLWTLARLLQGVGAALVPALAIALIPALYPGRALEMAGVYMAGNVLGGGLGRVLAGLLAEGVGVRGALCLLSLPALLLGLFLFRAPRGLPPLGPPRYDLTALPLYGVGAILLFLNLFLANLLPYRLLELGFRPGEVGLVYLAYLFGIPGSALSGALARRLGAVATFRLAFALVLLGLGLLLLPPPFLVLGFALMMAALFTAQSLASGAAGRRGSGVSGAYVAAFYLGGTLAGLLYPFFLQGFPLAVGVGMGLALLALLLAPVR